MPASNKLPTASWTFTYTCAGTVTFTGCGERWTDTIGDNPSGVTFFGTVEAIKGVYRAAGGTLTLTNVANAGTLELTGAIGGASTVTMKDATGTADVFNIKLNGAATSSTPAP